jgi:hypothetical protein
MAQFTDAGTLSTGQARPNAAINRTFNAFSALPTTDYSGLPTVSYIIPNNLHSTHGSNEAYPWAGSPDEENNDILRRAADSWLRDHLGNYLQWAKTHNSLLIITQDEERWTGGTATTVTTLLNGDSRLFVAGTNPTSINHYNLLRTIEDMYGLPRLNQTSAAAPLATNAQGLLAPSATSTPTLTDTTTSLSSSANPSTAGQAVTFTASVASSVSGTGTPTGTVTFKDGTTTLGTASLNASGTAAFTTSGLAAASHSISAIYGGDAKFKASTSAALTQTINPASSLATANVALASSQSSSAYGQLVTFTAQVTSASGSGSPTGSATFYDGSTVLAAQPLNSSGAVTFATNTLRSGQHSIIATYSGDSAFNSRTSAPLAQSVAAPTSAPPNDDFGAVTLASTATVVYGANQLATKQRHEPYHAGVSGGRSVWWTWTAPASGAMTIDTFGSSFDTLLAVYTGSSIRSLSTVASNNNASGNAAGNSLVSFNAVAGRQYRIVIDGAGGATGALTLHLNLPATTAARTPIFSAQPIRPLPSVREEVLG